MGINISVVKVLGYEPYEDYGKTRMLVNTEKQDWFDTLRYSGDKEFNNEVDFEDLDVKDDDLLLKRSADFESAKNWVIENVVEGNQTRLINALDKMRGDSSLAFHVSY